MDNISLSDDMLAALNKAKSFKEITHVIYQIPEKDRCKVDVTPFAKAYTSVLLDTDAFFSEEDGARDASVCHYLLGQMEQSSVKNSSDPTSQRLKECLGAYPHQVLLKHCNTFKDIARIITIKVPHESDLRDTHGNDYAEAFFALEERFRDPNVEHDENMISGYTETRDLILEMKLATDYRDRICKTLDTSFKNNKGEYIVLIIIFVLLIILWLWNKSNQ